MLVTIVHKAYGRQTRIHMMWEICPTSVNIAKSTKNADISSHTEGYMIDVLVPLVNVCCRVLMISRTRIPLIRVRPVVLGGCLKNVAAEAVDGFQTSA